MKTISIDDNIDLSWDGLVNGGGDRQNSQLIIQYQAPITQA